MSTKAKRTLAESLAKTFVLSIKRKASKSINTTDLEAVNAYSLGYLESFLTDQMAKNPKVLAAVVERMQVHATQE